MTAGPHGAGERVAGRVTFVVPTRNSSRTIGACLASLRGQAYADVEAIVADNGSGDGTRDVARGLADRVLAAGPERSAQRNAGAAAATGEFLVFLDSDMIASRHLAGDVARAFAGRDDLDALVLPERSFGVGFWARCKTLEKELYLGDPHVEGARAFRRSAFERAGGYDERIHGGGEDWELPERVRRAGGGVGRVEHGVEHDEGALTLRDDLASKFYYGRTFVRYARKDPGAASRKLLRGSLTKLRSRARDDPAAAAGLVVLKALELGAVAAGALVSVVAPHPAERPGAARASAP